jgi:hypothetical protein
MSPLSWSIYPMAYASAAINVTHDVDPDFVVRTLECGLKTEAA